MSSSSGGSSFSRKSWPSRPNEKIRLGTIETGKFAALVVTDRDLLTIPEDQIKEIKVEMTLIGGRDVCQSERSVSWP
jgi:predicted amidohydrolase YtcJ